MCFLSFTFYLLISLIHTDSLLCEHIAIICEYENNFWWMPVIQSSSGPIMTNLQLLFKKLLLAAICHLQNIHLNHLNFAQSIVNDTVAMRLRDRTFQPAHTVYTCIICSELLSDENAIFWLDFDFGMNFGFDVMAQ